MVTTLDGLRFITLSPNCIESDETVLFYFKEMYKIEIHPELNPPAAEIWVREIALVVTFWQKYNIYKSCVLYSTADDGC